MKTTLHAVLLITLTCVSFTSNAQWSAPLNISPGTSSVSTNENAGQCLIAVGDTLRITYVDHSSVPAKIMYNQSHDKGINWETPVQLFSSPNCGFTAIASSGSNVHIVWMDSLGNSRASFYKHSLDGGVSWGATICLDSFTKFWPGIACNGNLVIATLNKDLSGNTEVFIKRSLDNGFNWLAEQQISHALNRSEDPAINILGKDVHLSWNDKRSGTMNIYYCHSSDKGATWGAETDLTNTDSYTSMVCLNGNNVDVPHGIRTGSSFDIGLAESNDTGSIWLPNQQLTNTATITEAYPFMVRDESNMHVVYLSSGGTYYLYSPDGGLSWQSPLLLSSSGQPFIAYTGCVLHVMFTNAGYINYMRNPSGNCITTGTNNISPLKSNVIIYPNPVSSELTVLTNTNEQSEISIYNLTSRKLIQREFSNTITLNTDDLSAGIYFYEVRINNGEKMKGKFVKK